MIFLQAAVDELHFNLVDVAAGGTQPLGAQSALTEPGLLKNMQAGRIVGGNRAVKLVKVQKIKRVADNQLQTFAGKSVAAVLVAHNHNAY